MQIMGTDSGPPCPTCATHTWVYRVEGPSNGECSVLPSCVSCGKYDRPFDVQTADPTITIIREKHTHLLKR